MSNMIEFDFEYLHTVCIECKSYICVLTVFNSIANIVIAFVIHDDSHCLFLFLRVRVGSLMLTRLAVLRWSLGSFCEMKKH